MLILQARNRCFDAGKAATARSLATTLADSLDLIPVFRKHIMIPAMNHPAWEKLIKGEIKHKFSNAAASMLFFHLQAQYKRDPSRIDDQVAQARAFFSKYEKILADEIRTLF